MKYCGVWFWLRIGALIQKNVSSTFGLRPKIARHSAYPSLMRRIKMGVRDIILRAVPGAKLLVSAICLTVILPSPGQAQFLDLTRSIARTTVDQLAVMRVGSHVSLTGSLKRNIRRAQYLFADGTGEIRVRIENEVWRRREITNNMTLVLRGKIDNDVRGRFVYVYYFKIID